MSKAKKLTRAEKQQINAAIQNARRQDKRHKSAQDSIPFPAVAACAAGILGVSVGDVFAKQVCDSRKVSDHHAVIPTMAAGEAELSALTAGEREVLKLVARQVLMAVSAPYSYLETVATVECSGQVFTAKGKTVLNAGWKSYAAGEQKEKVLPPMREQKTEIYCPLWCLPVLQKKSGGCALPAKSLTRRQSIIEPRGKGVHTVQVK